MKRSRISFASEGAATIVEAAVLGVLAVTLTFLGGELAYRGYVDVGVNHELTELVKKIQQDGTLDQDVTHLNNNSSEAKKFEEKRLSLLGGALQNLKTGMVGKSVNFTPLTHLDPYLTGPSKSAKSDVAFLLPGYTAIDEEGESIVHTHKCIALPAIAQKPGSLTKVGTSKEKDLIETSPHGGASDSLCPPEKQVDRNDPKQSIPELLKAYPFEVVVKYTPPGIFFSRKPLLSRQAGYMKSAIEAKPVPTFTPAPCMVGGQVVPHGQTVTAYKAASSYCAPCESEQRTCVDGKLTGSFTNTACSRTPCNCQIDGAVVPHGATFTAFNARMVGACDTCSSAARECWDGQLKGDASFNFSSCSPQGQCAPPILGTPVAAAFCATLVTSRGNMTQTCSSLGGTMINGLCQLPTSSSKSAMDEGDRESYCREMKGIFGSSSLEFNKWLDVHSSDAEKGDFVFYDKNSPNYKCLEPCQGTVPYGSGVFDPNAENMMLDGVQSINDHGCVGAWKGPLPGQTAQAVMTRGNTRPPSGSSSVTFDGCKHWKEIDSSAQVCSTPCSQKPWTLVNSPLVLSFDGVLPQATEDTKFSFDGSTYEATKWLAPMEGIGFLAYDFNGDGLINDGTELFGEHTNKGLFQHGYHALARYFDRNGDAVVKGDELNGLVLWQDWNLDGVGQANELTSTQSHGIVELDAGKNIASSGVPLDGGVANPSAASGIVRVVGDEVVVGATFDVWFQGNEH